MTLNLTSDELALLMTAVSLRNEAIAESEPEDYTRAERKAWSHLGAKLQKRFVGGRG